MADTTTIPLTLEERLPLGEVFTVEASWETFLRILEKGEYPVQYDEGKILSFMGYGTEEHEAIIAELIRLLGNLLSSSDCKVFGSNLPITTLEAGKRYYNADCSVVKGKVERVQLKGEMTAVVNPALIVEVLSKSTHNFDLGQKFQQYKTIPSLQQILYVDSKSPAVISYRRKDNAGTWLIEEFKAPEAEVPVLEEGAISLQSIYRL
jgi:Uma2 family endonuclease